MSVREHLATGTPYIEYNLQFCVIIFIKLSN